MMLLQASFSPTSQHKQEPAPDSLTTSLEAQNLKNKGKGTRQRRINKANRQQQEGHNKDQKINKAETNEMTEKINNNLTLFFEKVKKTDKQSYLPD